MNEVIEVLKTRRSVRSFLPDQIEEEQLDAVLEAGTYAPSGMGKQSAQIVVVQHKELIKQLCRMNQEVNGSTSDPYYGAPLIILVFAKQDNRNHVQDGSMVLGNLMNAAHALGIGSCWINREREMFETVEGKRLMQAWGVEEGMEGIGALAMGYPAQQSPKPKPRKENYILKIK